MASLTLRLVKGSPLTYQKVDDNFTNLNNELTSVAGGSRNYLINGNFDIWQRGTSFTATGYTADRWRAEVGSAATISRQVFTVGQTDVPGEPTYFFRHTRTGAAGAANDVIEQRVEDVRTLVGQTATWTIWAKVSSGTKSLVPRITQNFGSGGSTAVDTSLSAITLTTSWQKFDLEFSVPTISGKTIGTSSYLAARLVEASGFSTFTADFAQSKLEKGSTATDFVPRPLEEEIALCERYYEKTYDLSTNPGTASATGSWSSYITVGIPTGSPWLVSTEFKVRKRVSPTVVLYSPTGTLGTTQVQSVDRTSTAAVVSENGFARITNTSGVTWNAGNTILYHFTSDAEL